MAGVSEEHDVPGLDSLLGLMSALGLDQGPRAAGFYRRGKGLEADYLAKKEQDLPMTTLQYSAICVVKLCKCSADKLSSSV